MILVIGILADRMVELMCARLTQMRLPYFFLDQLKFPQEVRLSWAYEGTSICGAVSFGGATIRLEDLTGVYARYVSWRRESPGVLNEQLGRAAEDETQMSLMILLDVLATNVVNRPSSSISNDSKVYQQLEISRFGFATPRALATTCPEEVRRFYDECEGRVIYKLTSGSRSIVQRLKSVNANSLRNVRTCPVLFQEYIEGVDIRVHTVGSSVFATEIRSEATDYRYAQRFGTSAELSPGSIPREIANGSVALSREFGLAVAGIDLRRTSAGKYYFFEVNPSPAFLYYERRANQPISESVARLLAGGLDSEN